MTIWLLSSVPSWLIGIILYVALVLSYPIIRWIFEGHPYHVSLSGKYGDISLILIIAAGARVLSRHPDLPIWYYNPYLRVTVGALCLLIGLAASRVDNSKTVWHGEPLPIMKRYHSYVVLPIFVWLLLNAVSALWLTGAISTGLRALMGVWLVGFIYDARTGRLDEEIWVRDHGYPPIWRAFF